jgi:flagellar hook assembly protein FlgD
MDRMFRFWILLIVLLTQSLTPSLSASDPDSTGTIEGQVLSAGKPVAYANVIVLGTRYGVPTNSKGSFRIKGIRPGVYQIRILAMGYSPLTKWEEIAGGLNPPFEFTLGNPLRVVGSHYPFYVSSIDTVFSAEASCRGARFEVTAGDIVTIDYWVSPGPAFLAVEILDQQCHRLKMFPRRRVSEGRFLWDGKDSSGRPVARGQYEIHFEMERDSTVVPLWRGPPALPAASLGSLGGEIRCFNDPIDYASVFIPALHLGVQADEHGRFHLSDIPTGPQKFRIIGPGFGRMDTTLFIEQGVNAPVTILVAPRGHWTGFLEKERLFVSRGDSTLLIPDSTVSSTAGEFRVSTYRERPSELTVDYRLDQQPSKLSIVITDRRETVRGLMPARLVSDGRWTWSGKDDAGFVVPAGFYKLRFITKDRTDSLLTYRGYPPQLIPYTAPPAP